MADLTALRRLFSDPEEVQQQLMPPVPPEMPVDAPAPVQPDNMAILQEYLGQKYQDRLKQAETQASEKTAGWGPMLAEFAANVGGAIQGRGGNAYSGQFDKMRQSARNEIVNPVRQERENALQGVQDQMLLQQVGDQREMRDTSSPVAKLYQQLAQKYGINTGPISARQGQQVTPLIEMLGREQEKKAAAADKNAVTFDEKGVAHPNDPANPAHVSAANDANYKRTEREGSASRQERILAASLGEKDYARQMKETERGEEMSARFIPGVGTFSDKAQAKEVREALEARRNMNNALSELNKIYLDRSPWDPKKSARAKQLAVDAQMAMKQGMNLGTLSESDKDLLAQLVPSNVNSPDILGTIMAQMEGIMRTGEQKWKNKLSGYQYTPDPKRAEFEALKAKAGK